MNEAMIEKLKRPYAVQKTRELVNAPPLPNSLPLTKEQYLEEVDKRITNRAHPYSIVDVATVLYHCEMTIELAVSCINTYIGKLGKS